MIRRLAVFFRLIAFHHTVFALPFAYIGMILARHRWPSWGTFALVTVAMVGARTAGMSLNRLIDMKIDALNPRTQKRPILTGEFLPSWTWIATGVALAAFFLSAFLLNPLAFRLSPVVLVMLVGYSYVKRFSFLCHWTLGAVLGIAPVGGWIAVSGHFSWQPIVLWFAVLFWVAGFDIIYSLQDEEFDRRQGLHSVPVKFGKARALKISAACHWVTLACLVGLGAFDHLGLLYWIGLLVCAGLLKLEHLLVSDGELARVNVAFYNINGWIGVFLLIFTFLDVYR